MAPDGGGCGEKIDLREKVIALLCLARIYSTVWA
jgi:hypothetical protein